MKPFAAALVLSLASLASTLAHAQEPARKRPAFHLPAGDYTVAQLLQQAELAVRAPLRAAIATAAAGDTAPIRLQTGLALPEQAWTDVLGALLATRDLVLVRAADGNGYEALAVPPNDTGWLRERAIDCTLAELEARRTLAGPVRVVVPTKLPAILVRDAQAPYLVGTRRALGCDTVDGGVALVGLADTVRFALTQLAGLDPELATHLASANAPAWPRATSGRVHRLAAGTWTETQIVDALAQALRRNIVLAPSLAEEPRELVVAESIEGDDVRFEDRLTALLALEGVLILECSAPDALYEAVRSGPPRWAATTRTQPVSAAELLARPEWFAWVSVAVPGKAAGGTLTQEQLFVEMRTVTAPGRSLTASSAGDGGLLLSGLSRDVALVLQRFATAAAAAASGATAEPGSTAKPPNAKDAAAAGRRGE